MVAKLVLDQLEKTGGSLNALTLPASNATANQYLQDNGSGVLSWSTVTAASTNVQRATGDVTIGTTAGYDVDGTTEIVVACNASAANRTITLPVVSAAGAATCIITVIIDLDATAAFSVKVQDSSSGEVWTGFQKGDFVRLIVSNGAWLVVDHKETYFAHRYLTAGQTIAASSSAKVTGWTEVTEIGNAWDNTNNKLVVPFAGFWDIKYMLASQVSGSDPGHGVQPQLYIGGVIKYEPNSGASGAGYNLGSYIATKSVKVAASTDIEFYSFNCQNTSYANVLDSGSARTQFTCSFTRTY